MVKVEERRRLEEEKVFKAVRSWVTLYSRDCDEFPISR